MRKMIRRMKERKGFTLLELIVAVAIMLVIGAAATPLLLSHIKDARVANVNEQLVNLKAAFDSYFTSKAGVLPSSSNYITEMVNDGWLATTPVNQFVNFAVKKYTDAGTGKVAYYTELAKKDNADYVAVKELLSRLDSKIDDGQKDAGQFQYDFNDQNSTITGFYLLYSEGLTTWH